MLNIQPQNTQACNWLVLCAGLDDVIERTVVDKLRHDPLIVGERPELVGFERQLVQVRGFARCSIKARSVPTTQSSHIFPPRP